MNNGCGRGSTEWRVGCSNTLGVFRVVVVVGVVEVVVVVFGWSDVERYRFPV